MEKKEEKEKRKKEKKRDAHPVLWAACDHKCPRKPEPVKGVLIPRLVWG